MTTTSQSSPAPLTADHTAPIRYLFVYGTLQPGDVRWSQLEPFVADRGRDDAAPGELFDTGLGYPAALFNGRSTIIGRTYALCHDTLEACLAHLDHVEDIVEGLYRRIVVRTASGLTAWAYEYGSGLELVPIPDGRWTPR